MPSLPTATQADEETHETPERYVEVPLVSAPHVLPFHRMMVPLLPTAMQWVALEQDTEAINAEVMVLLLQALPVHRRANPFSPTATQKVLLVQETPKSAPDVPLACAVQLPPGVDDVRMTPPLPTATQLKSLQDTARRTCDVPPDTGVHVVPDDSRMRPAFPTATHLRLEPPRPTVTQLPHDTLHKSSLTPLLTSRQGEEATTVTPSLAKGPWEWNAAVWAVPTARAVTEYSRLPKDPVYAAAP